MSDYAVPRNDFAKDDLIVDALYDAQIQQAAQMNDAQRAHWQRMTSGDPSLGPEFQFQRYRPAPANGPDGARIVALEAKVALLEKGLLWHDAEHFKLEARIAELESPRGG